jgi:hypothetical protein
MRSSTPTIDGSRTSQASTNAMYQLIGRPGRVGDGAVKIKFLDAGIEACGFTFG